MDKRSMSRGNTTGPDIATARPAQDLISPPSASALLGDAAEVAPGGQTAVPASNDKWCMATDTPVTDTRAACAVVLKETGRLPNKLTLSADILSSLSVNPEVRSYLPSHHQGPATLGQVKIILGVAEIEISDAVISPILTYDPSVTELLGNAEATSAPVNGFDHSPDLLAGHAPAAPSASQLEPGDQVELRAIVDTQAKAYAKAHNVSYAEAIGRVFGEAVAELTAPDDLSAGANDLAEIDEVAEASPLPTSDEPTLNQNFSRIKVLHGVAWDMMDQVASLIGALRVVLIEQESDPGSVVKAIHPETLASVAAKLIADHNELCDDMEMVTRQIHEQVFKKGESLPESVWLELVSELSKQRDALSSDEMWNISRIATNLLCFASSSPEVGAALGKLVEYSKRHGANLYHHGPSGTMTYQWLPGHHLAAQRRTSATH